VASGGNSTVLHTGTALAATANLVVGSGSTIAVDCGQGKLHDGGHADRIPGGRRLLHGNLAYHELRRGMGWNGQVHDCGLGVHDVPLLVLPGARLGDR
jgi:hypothetical protein